jgi:hypothetical protein
MHFILTVVSPFSNISYISLINGEVMADVRKMKRAIKCAKTVLPENYLL